jgi:hypothetical protein
MLGCTFEERLLHFDVLLLLIEFVYLKDWLGTHLLNQVFGFFLGWYYQGSTSIQVDLVKQYEGKHPVCYLGEVAQEEDYTVAMKGNWMISNGGGQGNFFLQLQVSN